MQARGWSAVELAERSGVEVANVYKYLQDKVAKPRGNAPEKMAEALGVNAVWLQTGAGPTYSHIPILAYVSAGEALISTTDGEPFGFLRFDVGGEDAFVAEVRGTSMIPAYRPGDRLVCLKHRGVEIERCVGLDCVLMTDEGEGYLKVLRRGSREGLYTLESYNRAYADIPDRRIAWAAPVEWIKRS